MQFQTKKIFFLITVNRFLINIKANNYPIKVIYYKIFNLHKMFKLYQSKNLI